MLNFIRKHPSILGSIITFLIILFLGVFVLETSWSESLLGSAVLTIVGVGGVWWKEKVWP